MRCDSYQGHVNPGGILFSGGADKMLDMYRARPISPDLGRVGSSPVQTFLGPQFFSHSVWSRPGYPAAIFYKSNATPLDILDIMLVHGEGRQSALHTNRHNGCASVLLQANAAREGFWQGRRLTGEQPCVVASHSLGEENFESLVQRGSEVGATRFGPWEVPPIGSAKLDRSMGK